MPVRIDVPAIDVHAPVVPVGLTGTGEIQVPPLDREAVTGWYDKGPTPGELGPAVVVGHVDSTTGPSVFVLAHTLKPGALITVGRADGRTVNFRVTSVETMPKTRFPTERVYGDLDHPGLRLVTCGGDFDRQRSSYRDNVVVYAELVR